MPTYCYESCGHIIERVFPVGRAPRAIRIGRRMARRSFQAERKGFPASKGWPLTCFASGVNANQAEELHGFLAMKGVPTEVTKDGDPVYRDARHRRRALKARGLFDRSSYV